MSESKGWSCYILECADHSYYVGVATDVQQREREHRHGGEAGVLRQHSQAVAQVFNQGSHRLTLNYSYLSANIGSTFIARRAGV